MGAGIIGIGTDLCDIRRIEKALKEHGERFEKRIFTKGERDYARSKSTPANTYAKRFAAKEALAKALSTPDTPDLRWQDVEVKNGASGKPYLVLHGEALERLRAMTPDGRDPVLHLTLTDERRYAQAFVIIEARVKS